MSTHRRAFRLIVVAIAGLGLGASIYAARPRAQTPQGVERLTDGIRLHTGGGLLRLQVKSDAIVRVLFSQVADPRVDRMVVVGPDGGAGEAALNPFLKTAAPAARPPSVRWSLTSDATSATIATARMRARVTLADGAVTFMDASGRTVLAETPGSRAMTPATVQGESTFHVQQRWQSNEGESLYGLGERQEGKLDVKGYDFDLWQRNTFIAMPFFVSNRGYGILWDNTSPTKFGDVRPFEPIPAANLIDMNGQAGGLSGGRMTATDPTPQTTTTADISFGRGAAAGNNAGCGGQPLAAAPAGGRGGPPAIPFWQGSVLAPATGDYQFQTYSNGGIRLWLDNTLRIDHYKQTWATENDQFKVRLEAGRTYALRIEMSCGANTLRLGWKTPNPSGDTSFWSEVGEAVDYYFVYGPEIDQVVAGYRALTGPASMLPRWAFGLWQSKNKYNTQNEVLDTLAEFRRRGIPIDNIVQDWQYWQADAWGTHQFEASRYPNPDAMIRVIHDSHAHFMISVWGKFYPATDNAKAMAAIDGLYQPTLTEGIRDWLNRTYAFYDAFSAPARKLFWDQVNGALFAKGVDAWWMDATEPDIVQPSPPTLETLRHDIDRTAIGTASRVMSAYPLMNSEAVYDGQRSVAPDERVFILTRSGFPGIQRYATASWSGDITSAWTTLRKQIVAGLGLSVSGDPYWTTDTGGYTMDGRFSGARDGEALDEWRELNARWFQFSTFCPLLRVHGTDRPREMWNIGDETTPVYRAELKSDQLRYALFPYIYATAGRVAAEGYTLMRPLVMDFRTDARALEVSDEYMFGPAFLVSPVTEYKARTRPVYLPAGTDWIDFWTGAASHGGQTVTADAPYDRIPLFVRAGAIVPIGSDQQYVGESDARTLTVYVYPGADGQFTLYEDDGLTYGYERQQASRIPFSWNDRARTLTIGARTGSFPGMPAARTFDVVVVTGTSGVGYPAAPGTTRAVAYRGAPVTVTIK